MKCKGAGFYILFLLLLTASQTFSQNSDDGLILIGRMFGPDPETYPVNETFLRWTQSILEEDGGIEARLTENVIALDGYADLYLEALSMGADELIFGMYDISGSAVIFRFGSDRISDDITVTDQNIQIDEDSDPITFGVDLLTPYSLPPSEIRSVIHMTAAKVLKTRGDMDRSFTQLNRAIELSTGLSNALRAHLLVNRAYLYGAYFGDTRASLTDLDSAIELDMYNPRAHANRGYSLYLLGLYEEAYQGYCTAIELFPDNPDCYYNRASLLVDLGYLPDAIPDYQMAVDLNPHDPEYRYDMGLCFMRIGDVENSILMLDAVIASHPDFYKAYVDRALVHLDQEEFALARDLLMESLEINSSYARTYNMLAIAESQSGHWEEVLDYAEKGMLLDPAETNFYVAASGAYMHMGDFDRALEEVDRACQVIMAYHNGHDPNASSLENLTEIRDELRELSEMDRSTSDYYYARGNRYMELKEYSIALVDFTEAIRLNPGFEDAIYMRGLCCMQTGDTAQAIEDMETVISMTTDSFRKSMAETNLRQLTE